MGNGYDLGQNKKSKRSRICINFNFFKDYRQLKTFRFQIGLRNYHTPTDHTNSCKLMRDIADKFMEYNVTTFHEYYPFADQA